MPSDAIVRVIYKDYVATCYNPEDGDLSNLGMKLLVELDDANARPGAYNDYINLLMKMEVVNNDIKPTLEQKQQLLPYTHIRLDRPGDGDRWAALLYGTRGGFDAMLRAGICCDNAISCVSTQHSLMADPQSGTTISPKNVANVYTIDLFSRTIHVMSYAGGGQQTYRTDETNMYREAWERNCLWLPELAENRIVDDANNIIPDNNPNPDNINYLV